MWSSCSNTLHYWSILRFPQSLMCIVWWACICNCLLLGASLSLCGHWLSLWEDSTWTIRTSERWYSVDCWNSLGSLKSQNWKDNGYTHTHTQTCLLEGLTGWGPTSPTTRNQEAGSCRSTSSAVVEKHWTLRTGFWYQHEVGKLVGSECFYGSRRCALPTSSDPIKSTSGARLLGLSQADGSRLAHISLTLAVWRPSVTLPCP